MVDRKLVEVPNNFIAGRPKAALLFWFFGGSTTLSHNLIKDKLVDLIERTFQREGSLYIACNDRNAFFTSDAVRNYNLWSCQKVCAALTFLLDNIYIRFALNYIDKL